MKVNFETKLVDIRDGSNLTYSKQTKEGVVELDLTAGAAASQSLSMVFEDEKMMDRKTKFQLGKLIEVVCKKGEQDISLEEANTILDRINKAYGPLVLVAMEKFFDPSK